MKGSPFQGKPTPTVELNTLPEIHNDESHLLFSPFWWVPHWSPKGLPGSGRHWLQLGASVTPGAHSQSLAKRLPPLRRATLQECRGPMAVRKSADPVLDPHFWTSGPVSQEVKPKSKLRGGKRMGQLQHVDDRLGSRGSSPRCFRDAAFRGEVSSTDCGARKGT